MKLGRLAYRANGKVDVVDVLCQRLGGRVVRSLGGIID
jgi:hypothetical protein